MSTKFNDDEKTKEEEGIMAAVAKPNTRAFMLKPDKVGQFVKKNDVSKRTMDRFHAHKPKDGVTTPLKKKDV